MVFILSNKFNVAHVRFLIYMSAIVLIIGIFSMFCGPAWSIELDHSSATIDIADNHTSFSSKSNIKTDSCLPLLKAVSYEGVSSSALNKNQRSAGRAAAIGLVFGVHFALGPKEVTKTNRRKNGAVRFGVWQTKETGGAKALAVSEYRRCKNEKALSAISDWRWSR